jgi:UDP-3-O-[3-hydroxymyristoyl] glucosamine N-acyltransferase
MYPRGKDCDRVQDMDHPGFYERAGPFTLGELARRAEAELAPGADVALPIEDVRPLDVATGRQASFLDNKKYLPELSSTKAGACFIAPAFAERVPAGAARMVTHFPYRAFARALALYYPDAVRPRTAEVYGNEGPIHQTARLGDGVRIERGAVVGPEAEIGEGTVIAAGAVIGYRVRMGRDGFVGPGATLTHALVGDRAIIHAGVRIGQDGFGFAMGPQGHLKVPQIGRVVIGDDVEIGANTTIDRGALKDTIVGTGTKIDNQVQIGHNVVIGRHCIIVGQVGISGSAELGDFVVLGGQSGIVGHIKLGSGAQIAGSSGVKDDVPAGERWGGVPAVPLGEWARQIAALKALAARKKG